MKKGIILEICNDHKLVERHILGSYPICTRVNYCTKCNKIINIIDCSLSPKCHQKDYAFGFDICPTESKKIPKSKCRKNPNSTYHHWIYHFDPTGIGLNIDIECFYCKLKKDITDYDSW